MQYCGKHSTNTVQFLANPGIFNSANSIISMPEGTSFSSIHKKACGDHNTFVDGHKTLKDEQHERISLNRFALEFNIHKKLGGSKSSFFAIPVATAKNLSGTRFSGAIQKIKEKATFFQSTGCTEKSTKCEASNCFKF